MAVSHSHRYVFFSSFAKVKKEHLLAQWLPPLSIVCPLLWAGGRYLTPPATPTTLNSLLQLHPSWWYKSPQKWFTHNKVEVGISPQSHSEHPRRTHGLFHLQWSKRTIPYTPPPTPITKWAADAYHENYTLNVYLECFQLHKAFIKGVGVCNEITNMVVLSISIL